MKEITFLIEESNESGYSARALGYSIFTEAETIQELKENIKEVIICHFEDAETRPKLAQIILVS
jgi:predicted RNase H-like HicB family nuclease